MGLDVSNVRRRLKSILHALALTSRNTLYRHQLLAEGTSGARFNRKVRFEFRLNVHLTLKGIKEKLWRSRRHWLGGGGRQASQGTRHKNCQIVLNSLQIRLQATTFELLQWLLNVSVGIVVVILQSLYAMRMVEKKKKRK